MDDLEIDERFLEDIDFSRLTDPHEDTKERETLTDFELTDYFGIDLSGRSLMPRNCRDYSLLRISKWPETKTVMEPRCVRIFGQRICTKWPIIYTRECKIETVIRICHPSLHDIIDDVEDCLRISIGVAIAILIAGGGLSAALAALKDSFIPCLKLKIADQADSIELALYNRKKCGRWGKI